MKTQQHSRHGGAVIIVVLSLLATLTVLGLFFFNWTSQDVANAETYAQSGAVSASLPDADSIFDDALQQIIVSVPQNRVNSALYALDGSGNAVTFWSLLAHELGPVWANGAPYDGQALNGKGITITFPDSNSDGNPDNEIDTNGDSTPDYPGYRLDYNGDGTNDRDQTNFVLNYSAAANGGGAVNNPNLVFFPDAGYTYPDINSLFLAADYYYQDPLSTAITRIIKPSFTLPGYLPTLRYNGFANQYTSSGPYNLNANQSMRPHQNHNGRYLTAAITAQSGDRTRVIQPYDFSGGTWGAWQGASVYKLDADVDGDGIDDSIDIDHEHPLIDLPDGRQVVPIFHWKIVDMDALLNANIHGQMPLVTQSSNTGAANMYSQVYGNAGWTSTSWKHRSHLGLSPSEVNPQMALYADLQDPNHFDQIAINKRYAAGQMRGYFAERWNSGSGYLSSPNDRTSGYSSINRLQIANTELAMMLFGSPEFQIDDLTFGAVDLVGRYGVDGGMLRNTLIEDPANTGAGSVAAPGQQYISGTAVVTIDDDANDSVIGTNDPGTSMANPTNGYGGRSFIDSRVRQAVPPFMHPLDYSGLGDTPETNGGIYRRTLANAQDEQGERLLGGYPIATKNTPVRWPNYPTGGANFGIWQNQGVSGSTVLAGSNPNSAYGYRTWQDAAGGILQPAFGDLLWNNANEMQLYGDDLSAYDAPFPASEIAALHLKDADWAKLGLQSRLRRLLPINFDLGKQASQIRSQFTTQSWDRLDISFAPYPSATVRAWEFNNSNKFPPAFGVAASLHENTDPSTATTVSNTYTTANIAQLDPFRPEIRRLLTIDSAGNLPNRIAYPQQRLQLNRILSDDVLSAVYDSTANAPAASTYATVYAPFDGNGNPQYRNLVPHVVDGSLSGTLSGMVHNNLTASDVSGLAAAHPLRRFGDIGTMNDSTGLVQEWWARYDRQRLARDIYVLLYTLSGHDGTNVDPAAANAPTAVAIDTNIARDMAQFAVNVVDAMDRDDVITKFLYDENLSDGWNSPTQVVYGTEAQQLVFHEAMIIKATNQSSDFTNTLYDESSDDHRFLYLELRNVSPFDVPLGNDTYRIVRLDTSASPEVEQVRAAFVSASGSTRTIPAGENYLLGCHDGTVMNGAGTAIGSEFFVNYTASTELECVVPKGVSTTVSSNSVAPYSTPANALDLDMTAVPNGPTSDEKFISFSVNGASGYTGTRLVPPTPGGGSGTDPDVTFSLQRRLNLKGNGVGDEWVEVDRIRIVGSDVQTFTPVSDSQSDMATALGTVNSRERFHHLTYAMYDSPTTGAQNHSMDVTAANKHLANQYFITNLPSTFVSSSEVRVWQPHYDRDFTSVMDLLSIPLYGPRSSSDSSTFPTAPPYAAGGIIHGGTVYNLADNSTLPTTLAHLAGYNTAQARFLFPNPSAIPAGHPFNGNVPNPYQNRWYRLLGFVGLPPSADDAVEKRLQYIRRTPGKINLNTLRHEHVLAGLIDDNIFHNGIANVARPTTDSFEGTNRNWMDELIFARDQADPLSTYVGGLLGFPAPGLPLPGLPLAKPFEPMGRINRFSASKSVASTLLRFSPGAQTGGTGALTNMGLFEARPTSDVGGTNEVVDFATRHRLLAKVANNATERSHVFAIWGGYELHDAHVNAGTGLVQIGAKAMDLPSSRVFLVVDMSRLEEAYYDPDPTDTAPGTYDFRKFIIHRQLLP